MLYLFKLSPLGDIVREHGLSFHFYADDSQLYTSFSCNDTSVLVAAKQRLENCVADINREFKITTTTTVTATSLNKRFNEQNNGCARAL